MARVQYRVLDAPRWGRGAFTPIPAASPTASTNGQNIIVGSPGTVPISCPRYPEGRGDALGPWKDVNNYPDFWLPSVYTYIPNRGNKPNTLRPSNYVMPVPAGKVDAIVDNLMRRAKIGGRRVIRSVRPFTQWPTYGDGN